MSRQIVVMGSGETSPTMVSPHQRILAALPAGPRVLLDTPFGFQENAQVLTERLVEYFATSVGASVSPVQLRAKDLPAGEVAAAVAAVREAAWVFAGPGSPSYTLDVWRETGLAPHLGSVLDRGALVLASAAALTAGTHTVPVYEIYKVGAPPSWLTGLNLIGQHTGLNCAVIPHFDNAEGGNHDTRYCYMGERRLRMLEEMLPDDVFILGVDEHTGAAFDLDSRTVSVFGRGLMTVRRGEAQWAVSSGTTVTFDDVAEHASVNRTVPTSTIELPARAEQVEDLMRSGDVLAAVDVLLELDELNRDVETRATVHALISRLGHLAASPRVEIADIVGPYIDALLEARTAARSGGRWDEADEIRNRLTSLRVVIRDSADGSSWEIDAS